MFLSGCAQSAPAEIEVGEGGFSPAPYPEGKRSWKICLGKYLPKCWMSVEWPGDLDLHIGQQNLTLSCSSFPNFCSSQNCRENRFHKNTDPSTSCTCWLPCVMILDQSQLRKFFFDARYYKMAASRNRDFCKSNLTKKSKKLQIHVVEDHNEV